MELFDPTSSNDPNRKCNHEGCNELGQNTGHRRKDGSIIRRATCEIHHRVEYSMSGAHRHHFITHPFCENKDGRLGYKCVAVIVNPEAQLQIDHKDGNSNNNDPSNWQTLCANCHALKTYLDRLKGLHKKKTIDAPELVF